MIRAILYYSNGTHEEVEFDSWESFDWFIHMEGDHLLEYTYEEV